MSGTPVRGRRPDPFGKQALFGGGPTPANAGAAVPGERGRRALFSGSERPATDAVGRGRITVKCNGCGTSTPLGLAALAVQLIPSVWLPVRRFSRFMRCPSCHRMEWCRVSLSGWPRWLRSSPSPP